jgi:alpha-beta hydrolase superfamily lysophospholipase
VSAVRSAKENTTTRVLIAAFAHPECMMRRHLDRFRIPDLFKVWVLRYVEWIIGHRYEEIASLNTACRAKYLVLLVHGKADQTVPVTDALAIRNNCSAKSIELLLIENADHESVEKIEEHSDQLIVFLMRVGIVG